MHTCSSYCLKTLRCFLNFNTKSMEQCIRKKILEQCLRQDICEFSGKDILTIVLWSFSALAKHEHDTQVLTSGLWKRPGYQVSQRVQNTWICKIHIKPLHVLFTHMRKANSPAQNAFVTRVTWYFCIPDHASNRSSSSF